MNNSDRGILYNIQGYCIHDGPGIPTKVQSGQKSRDAAAEPVDGDTDRSQLNQAIVDHAGTVESEGYAPYRDSFADAIADQGSQLWWIKSSPHNYLKQINASKTAMYLAANMTAKGLVYATEPLSADIQLTGHPAINLWASSTATDGDFIATIQDVAPDGTATSFNVHGRLRTSLRKLQKPSYNNLELPWHGFYEADAPSLTPGEPAELAFEILPISMIFKAGHRIRLVIIFADPRSTPRLDPAPKVSIYHDSKHRSYVTLPIIEAR